MLCFSCFALTNVTINLHNLLNAAGLHQGRRDPLLHGQTHPLWCLDADGCGAQLCEWSRSPQTGDKSLNRIWQLHPRLVGLHLIARDDDDDAGDRNPPWWPRWHIQPGTICLLARKCSPPWKTTVITIRWNDKVQGLITSKWKWKRMLNGCVTS